MKQKKTRAAPLSTAVPCTSDHRDGRFGPFCFLFRPGGKRGVPAWHERIPIT